MTKEPQSRIYSFTARPGRDAKTIAYLDKQPNTSETLRTLVHGAATGDLVSKSDLDVQYKMVKMSAEALKMWEICLKLGVPQEVIEAIISGRRPVQIPQFMQGIPTPRVGERTTVRPGLVSYTGPDTKAIDANMDKREKYLELIAALEKHLADGGKLSDLAPYELAQFGEYRDVSL